jgi:hypothetical protein
MKRFKTSNQMEQKSVVFHLIIALRFIYEMISRRTIIMYFDILQRDRSLLLEFTIQTSRIDMFVNLKCLIRVVGIIKLDMWIRDAKLRILKSRIHED